MAVFFFELGFGAGQQRADGSGFDAEGFGQFLIGEAARAQEQKLGVGRFEPAESRTHAAAGFGSEHAVEGAGGAGSEGEIRGGFLFELLSAAGGAEAVEAEPGS